MQSKLELIRGLKVRSQVYFGYCTWFSEELHSLSMFGPAYEFKRRFVRGIVRKVSKNPRVFVIHFPAIDSGRHYKFSTADLQNDQYFFSAEDLPANAIILEEEIPANQLFPSSLASEMSNLPNEI